MEHCQELTDGLGFDVVIETAGFGKKLDLQRLKPSKEEALQVLGAHGTLAARSATLTVSGPGQRRPRARASVAPGGAWWDGH